MIKVEYSKDLQKAKISNIGVGINNKKIVRIYEHDNTNKYKVNDTTEDEETLRIMKDCNCLVELTFYHNESIESLIRVLESLKNKDFIKEEDNPEMYKKIEDILGEKSNLEKHAERELNILLEKCEDDQEGKEMQKWINADMMEIVELFANQGHSGFSASYAINMLTKLLNYEPILPLTGADEEWEKLNYSKDTCYQNKRCQRVYKNENGQAYDIEGKVFSDNGGKTWYQSKDSRVNITFPYIPHTEKIILDNKEE